MSQEIVCNRCGKQATPPTDVAYGGRLRVSDNYSMDDFDVDSVEGGIEAYGFRVSLSNNFTADRWTLGNIGGGSAWGWNIDSSSGATLRDGSVRGVSGQSWGTGVDVQLSSNFTAENVTLDGVEGNFAIGSWVRSSSTLKRPRSAKRTCSRCSGRTIS